MLPAFLFSRLSQIIISAVIAALVAWFGGNWLQDAIRTKEVLKQERLSRAAEVIVKDAQIAKKDALIIRLQYDKALEESAAKEFRDRAYRQISKLEQRKENEPEVAKWATDRYMPND